MTVRFIKQQNKPLQFMVNNKPTNVVYRKGLSKTFRRAVRKQFKKKPFSLPQNIRTFKGLGINRAGNIVEFGKSAKTFQHSFRQHYKVYEIMENEELKHMPNQDYYTTPSYTTKNGRNNKTIEEGRQAFFTGKSGSPDRMVVIPDAVTFTKIKPMYHPALPSTIKMEYSLIPDCKYVDFKQKWNTNEGSCFYDYILSIYGTKMENGKWNNKVPKELRHLSQDKEKLWEVMTGVYDFENLHVEDDWSVNIFMISNLCRRFEISCYLINEADEFIFTYQNKHPKQKKIPPIYAMVTNGHINPIITDHKKKSLQHRLMGGKSKKEKEKKEPKQYEIVKIPFQSEEKENHDMFDVLCEKCLETGKTPLPLGLKLDEYRFDGFILDGKKYIYDTEDNQMGQLYSKIKGEKWNGTGMKKVAIKMFEEEHYLTSQLTPELYKLFTNKQVKDRSHRGFVNEEFELTKDVRGFDVILAFTCCVINPCEDWYIMGFDSVWENYNGEDLISAFYYVKTDDILLFHQDNIYSRCIVEYGLKKKIISKDNIKQVLKPIRLQRRDRFKKLFDRYRDLYSVQIQPKSKKFVVGYKYGFGNDEYTCINIGEEEEEYDDVRYKQEKDSNGNWVIESRETFKSKRVTFKSKEGIQVCNLSLQDFGWGKGEEEWASFLNIEGGKWCNSCDGFSALIDEDTLGYDDDEEEKKEYSKIGRKIGKYCCNLMTGLLGRKTRKKINARLSTNFEDVAKYYYDHDKSQVFCKSNKCGDKDLFMFGLKTEVPIINNHLPNYIQILDNMNIRQYQMMKKFMKKEAFGIAPIYRKVDMFCCDKKYLKNNYQSKLTNDIGGYKMEIPKIFYRSSYEFRWFDKTCYDFKYEKVQYKMKINDSSQIKEIEECLFGSRDEWNVKDGVIQTVTNDDSIVLMIEGDGGTGKTKIIQDLDKDYKCLKMSFTNKACINIGGTTYHRGLSLNKRLDITPSKFKTIEDNYDIIICEEFSMNTSWIWNYIYWLRELTTLPILLCGDWGQARPVEPEIKTKYDKYKDHPVVQSLIGSKIMLEKNYRSKEDLPFANFLHEYKSKMEEVNINDFILTDDKRFISKHLCYLNSTRKRINNEVAEEIIKRQHISKNNIFQISKNEKKVDRVSFERSWDDGVLYEEERLRGDDKDPTQTIKIFTGTPMIARMTEKKGETLFNNEDFIIKEISTEKVVLKSLNRKDDHPLYEIPLKDLQSKFLVAWCLTTHKAQGQTIKQAFKIHDWDKMNTELRYTAMSRGTNKKNVFIEPLKLLFIGDELEDEEWEYK